MKRVICCVLVLLLCVFPVSAVSAHSAVLLDGLTGEVLFEQNGNEEMPMASTTKIMTALVTIEEGNLDRTYKVKKEYTLVEGSSMYLREGEEISLRDTLYGLMLMSGNDAALALAGECGGKEAFVDKMNAKAAALGLTHTHFDNPNGLDGETHYTTAHELALIAAYAMDNEVFREIVSTRTYASAGHAMANHNKMLRLYDGAVGVKTGFTKKSGRCLVSAAERSGRRLIAVTLNAPDDWHDHISMLNDGFSRFSIKTVAQKGEKVGEITAYGGEISHVPLILGKTVELNLAEKETPTLVLRGRRIVYAPVFESARYGTAQYVLGGKVLAETPVYFGTDSLMVPEKQNWFDRLLMRFLG